MRWECIGWGDNNKHMNPENLKDNIYHILNTFSGEAKTWNGRDRSDKQFTQDRYVAAEALLKLILESRQAEIKQPYQLLDEWTNDRLKNTDQHTRQIIISDAWLVGKFLAYVWSKK